MKHGRPAITIFGFDFPDAEIQSAIAQDARPNNQTQLFARRLTEALQAGFQLPVHCISALPVSEFPMYPALFVRRSHRQHLSTREGIATFASLAYVNRGLAKIVTRQLSALIEAFRRSRDQRGGFVIVYSVHVPFMLSGLVLARLTKSTSVAVWTDPPAVSLGKGGVSERIIRGVEGWLARRLATGFDRAIAVSSDLAEMLSPGARRLVMEAITDPVEREEPLFDNGATTVVSYTGGVSAKYGVPNLVRALQLLPDSHQIVLRICGSGDYAPELEEISRRNPRIEYIGHVDLSEALSMQSTSDFLINARDPREAYTQYSFPSKILEYLSAGVPVATTILPGIPEEYWKVLIPIADGSPETIAETFLQLSTMTTSEKRSLGRAGRVLANSKSYLVQGERIVRFLREDAS